MLLIKIGECGYDQPVRECSNRAGRRPRLPVKSLVLLAHDGVCQRENGVLGQAGLVRLDFPFLKFVVSDFDQPSAEAERDFRVPGVPLP